MNSTEECKVEFDKVCFRRNVCAQLNWKVCGTVENMYRGYCRIAPRNGIHWLRSFVETTLPGSGFGDLVMDGSPCDVAYNGVRGATVNTFLDADMFARIIAARPHVVW